VLVPSKKRSAPGQPSGVNPVTDFAVKLFSNLDQEDAAATECAVRRLLSNGDWLSAIGASAPCIDHPKLSQSRHIDFSSDGSPVYVETRGLYALRWSPEETQPAPDGLIQLRDMLERAEAILQRAGVDLERAMEVLLSDRELPKKTTNDHRLIILVNSFAAVHGLYSPVMLALRFILSVQRLEARLDASQFHHAIGMADAWQQFFFEVYGAHQWAISGRKSVDSGKSSGWRKLDRDMRMAREFRRRRSTSKLSDTALMADIGRRHDLGRRASVYAIKRGLERIMQ
jgi:hypothetical protein